MHTNRQKKSIKFISKFLCVLLIFLLPLNAFAYWLWTPELGKWINPKYAPKDTPKEQFEYASEFYKAKDYKKAIIEFEKVTKFYPNSRFAAEAQYNIAVSYETLNDWWNAYLAYQKVIESFPYSEKTEEVIKKEYQIANLFYTGQKTKILGVAILPALDKAIEIFGKIVENAPYSEYAPLSQFKIGQCYKKMEQYGEAIKAFQKFQEAYPAHELIDDAKYEIAYCTYKSSLKPSYDQTSTEEAMKQFKEFADQNVDEEISKHAADTIDRLLENKAQSLYEIARFYEKQKKYESAIIYYEEIVKDCVNTKLYPVARKKVENLRRHIKR